MDTPLEKGSSGFPESGGILIIGGGLSGVSCGYWLQQFGMPEIKIADFNPSQAASYRNCGHILYGCVESYEALTEFHGRKLAEEIQQFSVDACHLVKETVAKISSYASCEYEQSGYHVLAISEAEMHEVEKSAKALNQLGYENKILSKLDVENLGFKNCFGGRFEKGSAKAHPVKFRNELLKYIKREGVNYFDNAKVSKIIPKSDHVEIEFSANEQKAVCKYDGIVICTNAYSPLVSEFFDSHRLVEPFKGQIITSAPLQKKFKVKNAHSFEHGYQYGLITNENRLMLGGWRNNTPTGEIGSYDLKINHNVETGLKEFVGRYYDINEEITWEYSWSGIMATSSTGLPFIGPTNHPLVFACSGYTGHGFSWAHGSAKLCAQIITGETTPSITHLFNPNKK